MLKRKDKPKYNMWQNSCFMIKRAVKDNEKKVLVLSILSALSAVALNLINLYVTPSILSATENKVPLWELTFVILGFVILLMAVSALSSYIDTNLLWGRIQVRSGIITALAKKASTTSYPNTGDEKFNKLSAKARQAVSSNSEATEAIWTTLTDLLKNTLGFIIYLFILANVDLFMALIIIAATLIGYFITKYLNEYGYRHREEAETIYNNISYLSYKAEDQTSAKDIRIFNLKPWLLELQNKAWDAHLAFYKKANSVYIWGKIADLILTFLRNGIAYIYLLNMVFSEGLSAAEFLLYFSAVGGFASWVTGILGGINTLHRQSLDITTVREYLEYPEPFKFEEGEALNYDKNAKYEIELKNLSFKYPGSDKYTLENINLTLHHGEKLAVVGLNGAGKTTLIKLLCGFYDPTEGAVLLNGVDIRKYNRRDYYKLFSAVFQDFTVLACSVAANIAQSEDDIDMKKVRECAEKAGLTNKIESLDNGFETKLNRSVYEDAVMLSGGETQRLMLARALYRDVPFIILDEPTAALDPLSEAELYNKYNEMTKNKSSVYISHRLASTRFCDRIIFIENNRITEEGTHEQLLSRGGRYSELFNVQSKYYREGDENEE